MLVKTLQTKTKIQWKRKPPVPNFSDFSPNSNVPWTSLQNRLKKKLPVFTSVTILFIGDAFQVKVMDSNGNIIHTALIPYLGHKPYFSSQLQHEVLCMHLWFAFMVNMQIVYNNIQTWIFSLWHSGGNISIKTICSFQTGSAVDFWVEVRPLRGKEIFK